MDPINKQVAARLKKLRKAAGFSLEELAKRSEVSRAMLSQIETLKTNPTIAVLWRISEGLGVSFADLIGESETDSVKLDRAKDAQYLYSEDKVLRSRPLLTRVPGHRVETYELRLEPGTSTEGPPHPAGSLEQVYVMSGRLEVTVDGQKYPLNAGDTLLFPADQVHVYACISKRAFTGISLILYGSQSR
jgi:transcriptional regulator with XRE-family HTH domain